jgi:hypothetical protein
VKKFKREHYNGFDRKESKDLFKPVHHLPQRLSDNEPSVFRQTELLD